MADKSRVAVQKVRTIDLTQKTQFFINKKKKKKEGEEEESSPHRNINVTIRCSGIWFLIYWIFQITVLEKKKNP